ncbi:MAG: hypothetical protein QG657_3016 [Acidobacteriota bacterium]|nr:hypothetical protein [Acidobacteriota bacterium]
MFYLYLLRFAWLSFIPKKSPWDCFFSDWTFLKLRLSV